MNNAEKVSKFNHVSIDDFIRIFNNLREFHENGDDPIPILREDSLSQVETCLLSTSDVYFGVEKYKTLSEKASNLFYCLDKGHKLANGNKRIAVAITSYFFNINERDIALSNEEFYKLAINVGESDPMEDERTKEQITDIFNNAKVRNEMSINFSNGGQVTLKTTNMTKIENLKAEINEYESILHEKGVPADEKDAAMDEIKDLKKQIEVLEAKEAAINDMRAEKKKKVRKQVGGKKISVVKKKVQSIKSLVSSTEKNKKNSRNLTTYDLRLKRGTSATKKKANMISVGANVKKFNKGRSASNIIRDKQRLAARPGKRTSAEGNTYYEKRANRSDVSKKDRLKHGGNIPWNERTKEEREKLQSEGLQAKRDLEAHLHKESDLKAGDIVTWKNKKGVFEVKSANENVATIVKIGHLSDDEYKGSYQAITSALTVVQKHEKGGSLYKKGGKVSKFAQTMREFKAGTLKSSSGDTVTTKNQALAIAFAESRKEKMQTSS